MTIAIRLMALVAAAALTVGCQTVSSVRHADDPEAADQAKVVLAAPSSQPTTPVVKSPEADRPRLPTLEELNRRVAEEYRAIQELEEEEEEAKVELPITINDQVLKAIAVFQQRPLRDRFGLWLARSGRYIPVMKPILKSYGLPEDLVYLALIESGFSCVAKSPMAAVGPWQFIKGTGTKYGLRVNAWVDERRDPVKSTHAAARYLSFLYDKFDDWYLAMAGYNAGEAKVDKAMKVHSADDFWSLAAASKSKEPVAPKRSKSKKKSSLVNHTVKSGETLSSIAAKYGVPTSAILSRNNLSSHRQLKVGQHLQIQTPGKSSPSQPGIKAETRNYVPQIIAAALIAADPARYGFGEVELQPAMAFDTVTAPFSVDLRGLAKEIGTTYEVLKDLNPELLHPITPQDGRPYELRLPQGSSQVFQAKLERFKAGPVTTYLTHTLAPGESPASVARKYKISVNALLAANDLKQKDLKSLKPGLALKVPSRSVGARAEPEPSATASAKRPAAAPLPLNAAGGVAGERSPSAPSPGKGAKPPAAAPLPLNAAGGVAGERSPSAPSPGKGALPPAAASKAEAKHEAASAKAGGARTHVVKAGENPWTIARRYHLTTAELLSHNNCGERLKIGQVLEIPGSGGAAKADKDKTEPAAAKPAAKGQTQTQAQAQAQALHIHVVKSGENLQAISRMYNVSQAQLISWNHLAEGRKLRVGQVLAVYVDRDESS